MRRRTLSFFVLASSFAFYLFCIVRRLREPAVKLVGPFAASFARAPPLLLLVSRRTCHPSLLPGFIAFFSVLCSVSASCSIYDVNNLSYCLSWIHTYVRTSRHLLPYLVRSFPAVRCCTRYKISLFYTVTPGPRPPRPPESRPTCLWTVVHRTACLLQLRRVHVC